MSKRAEEMAKFVANFATLTTLIECQLKITFGADYWRLEELHKIISDWNNNLQKPTEISSIGVGKDDLDEFPAIKDNISYLAYWINKRAYWKSLGKDEWL